MMKKLATLGSILMLVCLFGVARADDDRDDQNDDADRCEDSCHQDCSNGSTNFSTLSKCFKACRQSCRANVIESPAEVVNGPITGVPVACNTDQINGQRSLACASETGSNTCSTFSGTVVKKYRGGSVTLWVFCKPGTPFSNPNCDGDACFPTSTMLATTTSDLQTGHFTLPNVTNACGGNNGCVGFFVVTDQGHDPGGVVCKDASCPSNP